MIENRTTDFSPLEAPRSLREVIPVLEQNVAERVMSAWSVANREGAISCFHADEFNPMLLERRAGSSLHPDFDLASLTKPLFLNCYLRTVLQNPEAWHTPLIELMQPASGGGQLLITKLKTEAPGLTLSHFLNHQAGAKPWFWFGRSRWFFSDRGTSDVRIDFEQDNKALFAAEENLIKEGMKSLRDDTQSQVYSDVSYFLLARIIENLPKTVPFSSWSDALALINETYGTHYLHASLTPSSCEGAIPFFPYSVEHNREALRADVLDERFGSVHDTNANILASLGRKKTIVSGHAGLFGSVIDVVKGIRPFLESSLLEQQDRTFLKGQPRFLGGLDTASSLASSAGLFSWPMPQEASVFGHLGYTGTSFWLSKNNESEHDFHVLLTNRTSHRRSMGSLHIPRMIIVSDFQSGSSRYWLYTGRGLERVTLDDLMENLESHYRLVPRMWDKDLLRSPPSVQELRRLCGQRLWTLARDWLC